MRAMILDERWGSAIEQLYHHNKTMEILESAQYESTTGREMKRNNVCVARNVGYPSLFSSSSHPLSSLAPLRAKDLLISSAF